MAHGTVIRLIEERGFGFIALADGSGDAFFHMNDLVGLSFDSALQEQRVVFDVEAAPKGIRARNVRAAN